MRLPDDEHHPLARTDARGTQAGGDPTDLVLQLRPGQGSPAGLHERLAFGDLRGGLGHERRRRRCAAWRRSFHSTFVPEGALGGPLTPLVWPGDPARTPAPPQPAAAFDHGRRGRRGRGGGGERAPDRPATRARRRSSTSTTRSCRAPASSTSPAGCTAASSSRPARSPARPGSRPTSGSSGSRTPSTSPRRATPRSASSPGTPSPSWRSSVRRSSTRAWRTASGPGPARSPSCTSTRASGSGW